ncbi:hypothetical protein PTSG_07238 [Salpingoeca rosetta]|uniref:Thymus-specific serine protease n=1 Tax=Salpingoeca rosetta (strain ATCC 50818 / BSB-021) TaxID=946362 RepID=F2UEG4_SALR5|nr:uncharacterized protein PTSG_07238 [Salpingoeca rosetta]EGD75014.1 hypothetical protein PTSG_07238 [Salpingoeca rosetta]|eukprot:XP_004992658.1 hypothetical protein PTSG_07238 [Salpingoeca rosetta]
MTLATLVGVAVFVALACGTLAVPQQQHSGSARRHKHVGAMNQGLLHVMRKQGHDTSDIFTPVSADVKWFTQKVDHFNPQDTRTFQQQYQVNATYHKQGGPVFLMLGGEGPASPRWLEIDTAIMIYARQHDAVVVQLEHRFYGKSQPFKDLSTDHLQYLSSEQALADAANFLTSFMPGAPAVVFGGSYSGALAAFFRSKYPHLVNGAISTSSPVYALVDFHQYHEVVRNSLATVPHNGSHCSAAIATATEKIQTMLKTTNGRKQLAKDFNLCGDSDVTHDDDIETLFTNLAGNIDGVVQYNLDNNHFEGRTKVPTITDVCAVMAATPNDPYAAYANLQKYLTGGECIETSYANMIAEMKNTSLSSDVAGGMRQWIYQTCVEFGFYQTSEGNDKPFLNTISLKYNLDQCSDIYGVPGPNVNWTNANYGGYDVAGTNIVYVNGLIDPWHALSRTDTALPDGCDAIVIPQTAHCANMYPPSPDDPPALTRARETISSYLGVWTGGN